jgi:hypothetical protein
VQARPTWSGTRDLTPRMTRLPHGRSAALPSCSPRACWASQSCRGSWGAEATGRGGPTGRGGDGVGCTERDTLLISGRVLVLPLGGSPHVPVPGDRRIMTAAEASEVATQLDEDHAPETNGRMSVCRRCGARTDGPAGLHHLPNERELPRSTSWLTAEVQKRHLARLRALHRS